MAEEEFNQEMISFGIVASAGQARSMAFEALAEAKKGDFDKADELLKQAEEAGLEAHHAQTQLLAKEASGDHTPVDVLLVHAQDHLMTSMLAQELIREIIELRRELATK
ncbi:MAG TPA: PTS lactose/cellobiose transporter subunit IIA [Candidatus Coprousia avicola]|nr:PTS lactose/cellobiose transporter subunit IIA [Candidatus Coprousia avicola]